MLLYGGMDCRKEQLIKEFCVGKSILLSVQTAFRTGTDAEMGEEIQNAFQMKLSRYSYDEFLTG